VIGRAGGLHHRGSVSDLGLAEGSEVTAVIEASEVILATGT